MALPSESPLVAQLGWGELAEHTWTELLSAGVPPQLVDLGRDLGERTGRPLRVFTMPTMRVGIAGLAVPFLDDDGIVVDGSVLDDPDELLNLFSHELAHMLYPGWSHLRHDQRDEMEAFAVMLAPTLLSRLPCQVKEAQPLIDVAMDCVRAA
jgi:hypothetical protein